MITCDNYNHDDVTKKAIPQPLVRPLVATPAAPLRSWAPRSCWANMGGGRNGNLSETTNPRDPNIWSACVCVSGLWACAQTKILSEWSQTSTFPKTVLMKCKNGCCSIFIHKAISLLKLMMFDSVFTQPTCFASWMLLWTGCAGPKARGWDDRWH